jgi:hypothetical protein
MEKCNMDRKEQTFEEAQEDLGAAFADFWYQLVLHLGIIKLVNALPFLELRDWVKERESK